VLEGLLSRAPDAAMYVTGRAYRGVVMSGGRILVVEDQPDTAQSFAYLLQALGHDAEFVTDPKKALESARRLRPDVVFLDIGMSDIDGWQLARMFKAEPGFDQLHLVALTAYGRDEDRKRSRQSGFDAHILKPVGVELLQSILNQFGIQST
jgi:CheY-like chemotaxis protein